MYSILNQDGKKMAHINNMIILDAAQENVLGILIGDCFFGKSPKVVGKIFNSTAYLINGEIVGKIERNKEQKINSIKKERTKRNTINHVILEKGGFFF